MDSKNLKFWVTCPYCRKKFGTSPELVFKYLDRIMPEIEKAPTKDNVQWQERRLVIHGKGAPYGKCSKRRVIPMTERVRRLIEYHFAEHNEIGMSGRTIQRIVKRVANRAGIAKPVSPHVLRHTFAVNCIKKGVSTRALQTLLGHDRLTTTELYLNLSPEDAIREFMEKW